MSSCVGDRWQFTSVWGSSTLHEPCHNDVKMAFLCGLSGATFRSTLGHKNLLRWSTDCEWPSSRLTLPTWKRAAASVLIIKEAPRLSSYIVLPPRDGYKRLDYPFQCRLGKIVICCPLIRRPSHKSLLSSDCIIALRQWQLHQETQPCTEIAGDNASTQRAYFGKIAFALSLSTM